MPRYVQPSWPKEREERLRVLWADGLSYSKIGAELGVTRNAIAGKVHRLQLPKRLDPDSIRAPDSRIKCRHIQAVTRWRAGSL